ncbi:mitochondrial-processing peptidase subunit alpha-like, partial [Cucurbita maxima]|uniref:Mitochondrial-processing peptidase subunit alpha-like n=1 Tax=Cucurbita maxima TaxID=3661 RepID=A0A6J1HLM1_CUCMA
CSAFARIPQLWAYLPFGARLPSAFQSTLFDRHVQSCSFTNQVSNDFPALVLLPQKYKSSGGLFGWLLRDRSISSPLDFPLSDVNLPSPLPDYVESTPESAINSLSGTVLEKFVSENYTAARIVLAVSGVEHEELLSIAEPLLSDLRSVPREVPKSVYNGGDYRHQGDTGELPGGWHKEKDAMASTVLQNHYVDLDGRIVWLMIYFFEGSNFVPKAFDIAASELLAIATPEKVEQGQLDRAK